jgi:hypothetical protein
VLLCRADGGEHAELPEPSLCDDCEARGGNEGGQEKEDGGHGEDRQCLRRTADVASALHRAGEGRAEAIALEAIEGVERRGARLDEHGDPVRAHGRGRDESELVAQLRRVLDDAHDNPLTPVESQRRPDVEPEEIGDTVGDGDLVGRRWVAPPADCEELATVRAVRILRAELDRLDAAGNRHGAVADDIDRSERSSRGVETRLELSRIGAVEIEHQVCRAEVAVVGGTGIGGDRDAADRSRDRDREQRHDKELLPPLAPEHAASPADKRAAGGDATGSPSGLSRGMGDSTHPR